MEYLLAAVALVSLATNLILVRQLISASKMEYIPCELLEFEPEPKAPETVMVSSEAKTDSVTKKEQPALQAWTNKKNIPWSELDRPRQEPVRSQRPGPRERPPGFV